MCVCDSTGRVIRLHRWVCLCLCSVELELTLLSVNSSTELSADNEKTRAGGLLSPGVHLVPLFERTVLLVNETGDRNNNKKLFDLYRSHTWESIVLTADLLQRAAPWGRQILLFSPGFSLWF